jgi:hypothetical protein
MDHSLFLNPLNTFARNSTDAYLMLLDVFQGVLILEGENDRFFIYYDNVNSDFLNDCLLAENYRYADFLDELRGKNEIDMLTFLLEVGDKSPALDYLKEEQLEDLTNCNFYFPGIGSNINIDFIGMSWLLDAILLSFPTIELWDSSIIKIARIEDGTYIEEKYSLDNISRSKHGYEILLRNNNVRQKSLNEICPQCEISADFNDWFQEQDIKNKVIVRKKLLLASKMNFKGGRPLFDTLENTNGMREIRFSAHQGGAIRILFGDLADKKQAILTGFIKKANKEGYKENIDRSKILWQELKSKEN